MQSLHRGSFCVCRDGEKPVEGPDANPVESPDENPSIRSRCPWSFSPHLRIVYHKAL